jgi:hypothetical protein
LLAGGRQDQRRDRQRAPMTTHPVDVGPRRVQEGAVFGGEVQAVEGALDEVPLIERWANDPVDVGLGEAHLLVLDRGLCDDRREGEEVVGGDRAPERLQQVGDDPAAAERVENGSAVELIEQRGEVRNQAVLRPCTGYAGTRPPAQ